MRTAATAVATLVAALSLALLHGSVDADRAGAAMQRVALDTTTLNPMALEVADDGRVFYIERAGKLKVWLPDEEGEDGTVVEAASLDVYTGQENGLIGIALAPDFNTSSKIYLAYSPTTPSIQRIGRFTLIDNTLDLESEEVVYEWAHQRDSCCHSAGDIEFAPDGNLFISTGDNTSPFESDGFTPIDEREGRENFDAQRTSGNTNNPNGKILRITPNPDGPGHTIPTGNLYPVGTANTLPEVYAMGLRNPFRFTIDEETGWVLLGEYGPDAPQAVPSRGPQGSVEWNVVTQPGNLGWPYCIREDTPFIDFDFETSTSGSAFNCASPVNNSPNNTGLVNLPPSKPATLWMGYGQFDPRFTGLGTGGAPMGGPRYYYDAANPSPRKFPPQYDGHWFISEWNNNWIRSVRLDSAGEGVSVHGFPFLSYRRPMDMEFGPDGAMYIVEWGSSMDGDNTNSGVHRIEWVSSTAAPLATATASQKLGFAPHQVQFTGAAELPGGGGEGFTFSWDFGDESPVSTQQNPSHIYAEPGLYTATLTVNHHESNEQGTATVSIRVENPDSCVDDPLGSEASDTFDGGILAKSRWNAIVRENMGAYEVSGGNLTITTEPGDLYTVDSSPPPNNLILQSAENATANWTIDTKLSTTFDGGWSKAGLIAYGNGDNYVSLNVISDDGSGEVNRIELRSEVDSAIQNPQPQVNVPPGTQNIWLRLTKTGFEYQGEYSFNGTAWSSVGAAVSNPVLAPDFGLFAFGVTQGGDTASFDHFRVDDDLCDGYETIPPATMHELDPAQPGAGGTYDGPVEVRFSATDPGSGDPGSPQTHDVQARPSSWSPDSLGISTGDTIRWTFNNPPAQFPHDVWLLPPGGQPADAFQVTSGLVGPGGAPVTHQFNQAGSWTFFCQLHGGLTPGGMNGVATVAQAGSGSGVSTTEFRTITDGIAGDWQSSANTAEDSPFTSQTTVTEPGSHVVQYRSVDGYGNVEPTRSVAFSISSGPPPDPCITRSDEFTGAELNPDLWSFRHPTTPIEGFGAPIVSGGNLVMPIGFDQIDEGLTGPIGLVGQELPPGNFAVVARMTAPLETDNSGPNGYAQAGLMLYQSDDSFIKATRTRVGSSQIELEGQTYFEVGAETEGVIARSAQVGMAGNHPDTWWIRIQRTGNAINAYYSTEDPYTGATWKPIPITGGMDIESIMPANAGPIHVGAYTANGSINVNYDYIRFSPDYDCTVDPDPDPDPDPKPRIKLKGKPATVKLKAGKKKAKLKVEIRNPSATVSAGTVKLCVTAPKKRVKLVGKKCVQLQLGPGRKLNRKLGFKVKPAAAGKTVKIKLVASGPQALTGKATVRLKVAKNKKR